ncbi:MAG: L-threonylcarbamoyladenylate synthase [Methyloglobulus sp.]|nr:threonylcarbamoyl-AMP synthase [Methyloglobulus sp.]
MKPVTADQAAINQAADLLRQGRLVALPTETVYGLGADAKNPEAVKRIFAAKGRPADHPLIVHIPDKVALIDWAIEIPEIAWKLAERFWPGPLTIVLKKHPDVPMEVTGGQGTVALRVPVHPVALSLLQAFGGGIAAPSANRFCRISPTQASHVAEELGDKVDMILDGGACQVGLESTIVDLSFGQPKLLRPGQISKAEIEFVLQQPLLLPEANEKIHAPGAMEVHYAPAAQTVLCSTGQLKNIYQHYLKLNLKIGIATYSGEFEEHNDNHVILMPRDAHDYGRILYRALRNLDHSGVNIILVERPPQTEDWCAVNDRLSKASSDYQMLKIDGLNSESGVDKVKNEVLRKIGRNVILFQDIERMLKFLTIAGSHFGYLSELPALLQRKADTIQKLTMGQAAGLFLGNMYSDIEEYKETEEELKEIRLSFQFNVKCDGSSFETKKQMLSSIVADRNELIHHFLSKYNLQTIESCLEAEECLDQQRDKILPQHKELLNLVKYLRETLKEYDELVNSEEFQKQLELVNVRQSIVVQLLEDVSKQMARPDGWALLSLAGQLVKQHAPEELVAFNKKHGSITLKKTIVATGLFDLKEESTSKGGVRLLYKLKPEFDFEYSDQ